MAFKFKIGDKVSIGISNNQSLIAPFVEGTITSADSHGPGGQNMYRVKVADAVCFYTYICYERELALVTPAPAQVADIVWLPSTRSPDQDTGAHVGYVVAVDYSARTVTVAASPNTDPGDESLAPKCDCGSDAVGSPRHSDWCPKHA